MNDAKKDYRIVILVSLCLIAAIIVVYGKAINFDFVGFDDELYVTQNYHVQKGISIEGIKWAFTTFRSANWHPLTWLSHMLDCELYGLNPTGHHWTNVEFHIANTLLLFFILFKMTGTLWQSAFVAALFGLHPLHVESVAWISERKDILSTFFGLSSIAAYYRYVKKSSSIYYFSAIFLFSLSLMAKPMLVTLPFVLLLLDFWPLKRFQLQRNFLLKSEKETGDVVRKNYRIILEKIPFFVIVVGSCIITFLAQKSKGAVMPIAALPLKYRIENAVVSYVKYVFKAIWPHKLAVFYPHPLNTLHLWQIVGAGLLLVFACYGALRTAKKYPYILVGLLWYLGTLVPVIGLVQVGNQAMADRYSYVPLIGIFMIVAWGAPDLLKKQRFKSIYLVISAAIILITLSSKTYLQLNVWKKGITLFKHAVSVTENNYLAYNNLGTAFEAIDLDKAMLYFKTALKIRPNDATALYNLGNVFLEKGHIDKARQYYLKALNVKPNYTAALNNLGEALTKKGDYDKANYYFKRALKTDPTGSGTCMNFANALFLQAKPDIAIALYKKILQTDSENPDVHYNLAYVLSSEKKYSEAICQYNKTLSIDPKYLKAHYHLGNIYLSRGNTKKAFMHFATVIKLKPDYIQAYNKLGLILFKQGKFKKAEVFFSKARQLDPDFSKALTNLDIVRKRISK